MAGATVSSDLSPSESALGGVAWRQQALRFIIDFGAFAGRRGIWGAVLAITGAGFESVGLVLLVPLLAIVTASGSTPNWIHRTATRVFDLTGAQSRTAQLSVLLSLFGVLIIVRAVVTATRDTTLSGLQIGFVEHVRSRLGAKLAAAPWPVVSRLQHARVTNLLSGDIQRVGSAALFTVQLSTALVLMISQVGLAFLLGPALAGLAIVLIAIGALAAFAMLGRAHDIGARLSRNNLALMHETTQFLGGLKLAAGQNRQADFVTEFEASLAAVKREQFAFIRRQNANRRIATIVSGLTGALIAFVGLTVFDTSPPVLIAMLLVFTRISAPVMQISQALQQFVHTLPAYAEVCQLEAALAATPRHGMCSGSAANIKPGTIIFRDVSFRHDEARQAAGAISHLSLTIEPGSFVGITGPSGAGKTTFADLLIGLLEPQSGAITINGAPLQGSAAVTWRDHISYVVQDPYLFRDTVRRNLLWASPQSSDTDIRDALAMAEADTLVTSLANGLDTVLGERGTLISGGERQRLCLARAILRRPWLFVLDEATSAIDVATEQKILKRFRELEPRPTIVMIAHRDESLAACDRILRFENGTLSA
ncbi:MAG TPA: ABC transporter ATP-binding protein [Xanthobacteraceae bacterium]|jgi:ATP-binding cassette subfamily C protein|nr:ABC transporter ATP-binding protein [Xanthobacteraceae bacterium]